VQPETNETYDPKNWPETDIVTHPPTTQEEWLPSPEVQAQAANLIVEAQGSYAPFNESGTMCPPSPEMVDDLQYQPTKTPLRDGRKPDYYRKLPDGTIEALTKAEYKAGMRKEYTVQHRSLPCGHKLVAGHAPRHRNCDACWFTFFNFHGELTQAVEEAYNSQGTEVGRELVKQLRGDKFLRNFLKFMSTISMYKEQLEKAK
jgi:hypothetical protein